VTNPFSAKARMEAGPASPAAIPVNTNIPAPIMAPTPIMVASNNPRSRAKVVCEVSVLLFLSISANFSGAKKGLRSKLSDIKLKPKSLLQSLPPNFLVVILIIQILGVFEIGTLDYREYTNLFPYRIAGLILFAVFSWFQILSFKTLGKFYAQDVLVFKDHIIIDTGIYKFIRHPQYISQILADIGAGLVLMSYFVIPLVVLIEIPLLIARALLEEKTFSDFFGNKFLIYKQKTGFILPFIG